MATCSSLPAPFPCRRCTSAKTAPIRSDSGKSVCLLEDRRGHGLLHGVIDVTKFSSARAARIAPALQARPWRWVDVVSLLMRAMSSSSSVMSTAGSPRCRECRCWRHRIRAEVVPLPFARRVLREQSIAFVSGAAATESGSPWGRWGEPASHTSVSRSSPPCQQACAGHGTRLGQRVVARCGVGRIGQRRCDEHRHHADAIRFFAVLRFTLDSHQS